MDIVFPNTTNLTQCEDEFKLKYHPLDRTSHATPYILLLTGLVTLTVGLMIRTKVWNYAKTIMQLNLMQSAAYLVLSISYFVHFYSNFEQNRS